MIPPLRWAAAVACAVLIFIVSSMPNPMPRVPSAIGLDKLAHVVEYFIFTGLLWWALSGSGVSRALVLAVVAAAVYAATDEIHQYFVPGRVMSVFDWLADVTGAALWALIARRWRTKHASS